MSTQPQPQPQPQPPKSNRIKAVWFDFMGTCLDWHSAVTRALPSSIPPPTRSELALEWRQAYFDANAARIRNDQPPEDIDVMLSDTLDELLLTTPKYTPLKPLFTLSDRPALIAAWHRQPAWPDVAPAIRKLKEFNGSYEVFVHANGTTRLQLDLCRSSGLSFDMLFSSELLGVIKPAPGAYEAMLKLTRARPEECVMVAAHAYDTRGAKAAGLKTVYVYRWTDDVLEDQELIKTEFDAYLENMDGLAGVIASL